MGCEWTHPAKVACTAGRNLVQCHLLGLARDARVVLLHSRPEEDEFLGLARPSQVPQPTNVLGLIPCFLSCHSQTLSTILADFVLCFSSSHVRQTHDLCWCSSIPKQNTPGTQTDSVYQTKDCMLVSDVCWTAGNTHVDNVYRIVDSTHMDCAYQTVDCYTLCLTTADAQRTVHDL